MASKKSAVINPETDIPHIEVTFSNGLKQQMVLRHYNAIPNSETINRSRICNYLGYLKGDETESSIAVTGCLFDNEPDEKMHITILSKLTPFHKSFSLDSNGTVNYIPIQSNGNKMDFIFPSRIATKNDPLWRPSGSYASWYYNESVALNVSQEEMANVPPVLKLKIRIGYDRGVKEYLTREGKNIDNWLAEVMTHAQAHYLHPSLRSRIYWEVHVYV